MMNAHLRFMDFYTQKIKEVDVCLNSCFLNY